MSATTTGPHLTDSEIVGLADGAEGGAGARQRHVEDCPPCAAAIRAFRDDAAVVSDWLARAAFEEPWPSNRHGSPRREAPARSPRWAPWLKVAAAVIVVAGPLAALPSVRAWVGTRIQTPGRATGAIVAPPESTFAPSTVRFIPDAGTFTVHLAAGAPGATLTLVRTAGPEARLRTSDPALAATVSSSAIHISAASAAEDDARTDGAAGGITLELPGFVEAVEVRIGGRVVRIAGPEIDRGRTLDLVAERPAS